MIPLEATHRVLSLVPPSAENGIDRKLWPGDNQGNYTVASSYAIIAGVSADENHDLWRRIWKCEVPERVRYFLWIMVHD